MNNPLQCHATVLLGGPLVKGEHLVDCIMARQAYLYHFRSRYTYSLARITPKTKNGVWSLGRES
jgi:hypothetical protein